MKLNDIAQIFSENSEVLQLKEKAMEMLEAFFTDQNATEFTDEHENEAQETLWGGYTRKELEAVHESYNIEFREQNRPVIKTRIALCIPAKDSRGRTVKEQVGHYTLHTDLEGNYIDDQLLIDKEKFIKEIDVVDLCQNLNSCMPKKYLRRNHIQYPFASYLAHINTLLLSKDFEGAGLFLNRAYSFFKTTDKALFEEDYHDQCQQFLNEVRDFLLKHELISTRLKDMLQEQVV